MHADSALDFATAPKQTAQCEMQFDSLRINLDDFDERLNRLVGLLIQQKTKPFEIGARQHT